MKYYISYIEYKDYPELTQISLRRERLRFTLYCCTIPVLILGIIFSFVESNDRVLAIILTILSIISLIYLFVFFNKVTEYKIRKKYKEIIDNKLL